MKFVFVNFFLLIFSVGFLYYLLMNNLFVPFDEVGNINILNVSTTVILLFVIMFTLISILSYFFYLIFKKELTYNQTVKSSIKISSIISIGLVVVLLLHIFHILDILLGFPLLIVVLILILVVS